MNRIAVIGVGNILLKDDGIGPRLVDYLNEEASLPGVRCVDAGTQNMAVTAELFAADGVIIVDAVNFGGVPGQAVLFTEAELSGEETATVCSAHQLGLAAALQAARARKKCTVVKIIGIQPAEIGWDIKLSRELQEKIPALARLVLTEACLLKEGKV